MMLKGYCEASNNPGYEAAVHVNMGARKLT